MPGESGGFAVPTYHLDKTVPVKYLAQSRCSRNSCSQDGNDDDFIVVRRVGFEHPALLFCCVALGKSLVISGQSVCFINIRQ